MGAGPMSRTDFEILIPILIIGGGACALRDAPAAYAWLKSGAHVGKVMITGRNSGKHSA